MAETRILTDCRTEFITVLPRHEDISENQVRPQGTGLFQSGIAVIHHGQFIVFVGKGDANHFLDGNTVVGQQQFFAHSSLLGSLLGRAPDWFYRGKDATWASISNRGYHVPS